MFGLQHNQVWVGLFSLSSEQSKDILWRGLLMNIGAPDLSRGTWGNVTQGQMMKEQWWKQRWRIPDEIEINEISRHNMAQQSFLYSLRLTLATYHLPFVWFQVVSGRYPGVLLWDWNKSTPQPLFLQATSTTSWASKPSGGWSKFLDPNTAKEYWWHDSGRPTWCVGGNGSLKKTFFQHGTWFQFKCCQIL